MEGVLNEIVFLRQLTDCKNIVNLHQVYYEEVAEGVTKYILVMNFARHGCLLRKLL